MSTTIGNSTTNPAAATAALAATPSSGTSGASASQNQFLSLLVTQLKNQDPLNPMDNAQITSQMAQISTVTGIDQLNTTLQAMAASFSANQSLQATALIGHSVLAPGNGLQLQNGTAQGGVSLPQAADSVVVSVADGSGQVVHTVNLGAQPAGVLAFQWDGVSDSGASAVAGGYTFTVQATQGGHAINAVALASGVVSGLTPGAAGATLQVSGLGQVALSSVTEVM